MLMKAKKSCLLIIDVQTKLSPAITGREQLLTRTKQLIEAASILDIPIIFTEQYPKGLGHTEPELMDMVREETVVEKVTFSCMGDKNFKKVLAATKRKQVIVTGMETHVCVLQTVMQLLAADYTPFVVADAVSSRDLDDYRAGLVRMRDAGAISVTTEMVLFEWMERAGTDEFKQISKLIK